MKAEDVLSQAKKIWEIVFGDSAEFIDRYFQYVGQSNIVYLENDGQIEGFSLVPLYNFSLFSSLIKADYVSGL